MGTERDGRCGGKRRFTVNREMVCTPIREDHRFETGYLVVGGTLYKARWFEKKLIVETTFIESCISVNLKGLILILRFKWEPFCRDDDELRRNPRLPIWH